MDKTCIECGMKLEWVGSGPGWMNSDQWDACKAGDYFSKCDNATHENGNCYFKDTATVSTLKPRRSD
jgi:hypothetical protein